MKEIVDKLLFVILSILGKWSFQGWIYWLKRVPGKYFQVPTSTPFASRGHFNKEAWML